MAIHLDHIVPWGRSLREYELMFNLTAAERGMTILDCGGGPSSFTPELSACGGRCHSVDPLYLHRAIEIRERFLTTVDNVIAQVDQTPDDWVWTYHGNSAGLRQNRINVMERFLADFQYNRQGRYVVGALPSLPFNDQSYHLCLCSHLLFLYSHLMSCDVHVCSVTEMLRVAREVRIFPLLTLQRTRSPYIDAVIEAVQRAGYTVTEKHVGYELQRGGNHMLRIRSTERRTSGGGSGISHGEKERDSPDKVMWVRSMWHESRHRSRY